MEIFPSWIVKLKIFQLIVEKMNRIYLTKDGISLQRVSYIFLNQIKKDQIQDKASAMAFNFTLSIFPLIIFLFTLIPYIPIPNLQQNIMGFLKQIMPLSIYESAESTILEIISIQQGGLLSFGFFLALYAATNGVVSMIQSFNKCYRTADTRGFFSRFFLALSLVFIISITIMISITVGILFTFYLDYLDKILPLNERFIYYFVLAFKYGILFFIFWIIISLIYYIAPNVIKRWRFLSLGSFIASLMGILFTLGFSFYIENFNSYNKIYGSIGTFIGVLIWLFVISYVLLIGFEINASIDQAQREQIRKVNNSTENK
ncbi:MAG: YihY/virulence factor BrkB family protein [Cytophagales bacterium]|nr:MAG: YihY/virulence factor BrkB family protein [Cytophagales bacterium]